MKCVICRRGETRPGTTTVTLEREGAVVVVRGVPADVCEVCGEAYLSGTVGDEALKQAETALSSGAMVQVANYVAA